MKPRDSSVLITLVLSLGAAGEAKKRRDGTASRRRATSWALMTIVRVESRDKQAK